MDHEDESSWQRSPDPGEPPPVSTAPGDRGRGSRRAERVSNVVAAAFFVAGAATLGYLVQADMNPGQPVFHVPAVSGPGAQPETPGASQPCVTAPAATSGVFGVTAPTLVPACAPGAQGTPGGPGTSGTKGANGANNTSAGTRHAKQNERGDR